MRIQHNIAAQNSQRQLSGNNGALGKNLEKLSSGYRINKAGDDAAGLAISEKMRSQITGLKKAQDNANDGISLVQTAEGALTEVHSMLNRMTELATQSANGTFDNETDRSNLQKEVDSLLSEIDRISESTNFNGINLLDGSLGGGTVKSSGIETTGKNVSTFSAANVSGASLGAVGQGSLASSVDTFDVDGQTLKIDWSQGEAKNVADYIKGVSFGAMAPAAQASTAAEIATKLQTLMNDEMRAQGLTGSVKVSSNANNTFKLESANGTATSTVGFTGSSASLGAGNVAMGSALFGNAKNIASTEEAGKKFANTVTAADEFTMKINGSDVNVSLGAVNVNAGTSLARGASMDDVAAAIQNAIQASVLEHNAKMGYVAGNDEYVDETKFSVTVDKSGGLKVTYEGDNKDKVNFSFGEKTTDGVEGTAAGLLGLSGSKSSSATGGSGLTLQVGDTAAAYQKVTVSVGDMSAYSLGIKGINIGQQTGAEDAMKKIKTAINSVSATRGDLGAVQNRLEHTINNLGVTEENMTSAESRVRDVDMAKEMMTYTKNNILVQASQSMLAQANQLPQGVLQLLG